MVELSLLGTFEARLDGRPVPLRPKQRALLAVLALRAGESVPVDRLIDDLWGEQPPATATASLQNAVSLVRRALGAELLVTSGGGYALAVEPEQVDALRFEGLVAEAQGARGEERAAILRRALALWRGPALGDLAFEPFSAAEAPRLDELRLSAREQLAEAELALGRHETVLGELEALIESSPFRERPRALLMLALYRSGRQADALEAFQTTRRVLREELGLEPTPALRAIQAAMLRQDPALDPPEAAQLPYSVGEERHKTVTVFFCDLVESTALAATLDPEVYRAVLRRYYRAARDVLEGHGGTVEKFVGDAVVAVFGVPTSHEDVYRLHPRAASAACSAWGTSFLNPTLGPSANAPATAGQRAANEGGGAPAAALASEDQRRGPADLQEKARGWKAMLMLYGKRLAPGIVLVPGALKGLTRGRTHERPLTET